MEKEQLFALAQEQLVGRVVLVPVQGGQGPVPGMVYCPCPPQGTVTALRDDWVYGMHVVVEAPGFQTCCFQLAWALEHLVVIGE